MMSAKTIADDHANEFIARLRQWQGFPLTEYQQNKLRESYLAAIDKAVKESRELTGIRWPDLANAINDASAHTEIFSLKPVAATPPSPKAQK
jgi:hypothetical protein